MVKYPIWKGWYGIAEPINRFAALATIALSFLWWILNPIQKKGYNVEVLWQTLPLLIVGIIAGVFYILILQKAIALRDLSPNTHVWLWIVFVLSWFPGYGGVFIWIQFIMVGCLSDMPFWEAFSNA